MEIASLVLGIVSLLLSWIPCVGWIVFLPAIVGLVLGIIDTVLKCQKGEKKSLSIAGLVLSAVSVIIAFLNIIITVIIIESH